MYTFPSILQYAWPQPIILHGLSGNMVWPQEAIIAIYRPNMDCDINVSWGQFQYNKCRLVDQMSLVVMNDDVMCEHESSEFSKS